jgi:hypothetical protein
LSPERRDFHNRIQAAAQFADKEHGLLLLFLVFPVFLPFFSLVLNQFNIN